MVPIYLNTCDSITFYCIYHVLIKKNFSIWWLIRWKCNIFIMVINLIDFEFYIIHLCFLNQSLAQNSYKENSVSSCVPALLMNFWFNRTLRNGFGTDPRKSMQFQSASANWTGRVPPGGFQKPVPVRLLTNLCQTRWIR